MFKPSDDKPNLEKKLQQLTMQLEQKIQQYNDKMNIIWDFEYILSGSDDKQEINSIRNEIVQRSQELQESPLAKAIDKLLTEIEAVYFDVYGYSDGSSSNLNRF